MTYDDLFKTAMELYERQYPKEYAKNVSLMKELACDLSYISNMSLHEEISEVLRQDPLFLQCLVAIAVTGSSFRETINSFKEIKK